MSGQPLAAAWLRSLSRGGKPLIEAAIGWYVRQLDRAMNYRLAGGAGRRRACWSATLAVLGTRLRREFFPEVDSGAFEIYARAASGTRIEETEKMIARVEQFVRETIGRGPADHHLRAGRGRRPVGRLYAQRRADGRRRQGPAQARARALGPGIRRTSSATGCPGDPSFRDLEFAFDAGGMIRSAMNEGKSSPINIRLSGKNMTQARSIAEAIKREVVAIDGVVDARIIQRLDYPEYIIEVDRAKVADLGLNQAEVMKNVVAALNSSIQFHKKNFWIDPVSKNQYFVGVQYFEEDIDSVETLLDVPITELRAGASRSRCGTSPRCAGRPCRRRSRTTTSSRRST